MRKSLREDLKNWDRKEFDNNSKSYELEMLYESTKTTLSAQQKNDLARFIRKAKTAEEINTYMTGILVQGQANESLNEDIDKEVDEIYFNDFKDLAYELDDYIENEEDIWIRDFDFDPIYDKTITFYISGDWKHDHWRFKIAAEDWLDKKGVRYNMTENILDDSESDYYYASHVIRIYDLGNGTKLTEKFNYKKTEKDVLKAINNIGGEAFQTYSADSTSYRFNGEVSIKALITNLVAELKNMGYDPTVDKASIWLQDDEDYWQGLEINIYKDDNEEKGFSFYEIEILYSY